MKHITKNWMQFLNEEINISMPIRKISKVYHVGNMNIEDKSNFSLEGSGLSVSKNPEEWRQIARLGNSDLYLLNNTNGIFLDAYKLNKNQKNIIINWGVEREYVEPTETYRVLYGDGSYMEFEDLEKAKYEAGDEYKIKRIKIGGLKSTNKLKTETKQSRIDVSQTFDLLLTIFVEKTTNYDGIWWNDRLDVLDYSAPRGVIFNSKLNDWKIKKTKY